MPKIAKNRFCGKNSDFFRFIIWLRYHDIYCEMSPWDVLDMFYIDISHLESLWSVFEKIEKIHFWDLKNQIFQNWNTVLDPKTPKNCILLMRKCFFTSDPFSNSRAADNSALICVKQNFSTFWAKYRFTPFWAKILKYRFRFFEAQ